MKKVLRRSFFNRNAVLVAQALLGTYLVRRTRNGKIIRTMITEIEAYEGFEDKASHAHRGKTPRNAVMFGEAGHWYVYLCYGMHYMLNIVCGKSGYPAAVLVRGVEEISGPGRLTKALSIRKSLNAKAATPESGLWIEDRGVSIPKRAIVKTPRIGVAYAGPRWANKKYRFLLRSNPALPHTVRHNNYK